jgi:anti-anti-sigma regulatory factor
MLRITVTEEPKATRFVVEGKLTGDSVSEFEKCWRSAQLQSLMGDIVVDLSGVTFIDACGKQLLCRMREKGIKLVACGLLPKAFIEEIEHTNPPKI